jgi:putative transposase
MSIIEETMFVAVRFRIYPSQLQRIVLNRWIGAQRFIYNRKEEELRYQLWLRKYSILSDNYQTPAETWCPWNEEFSRYKILNPWLKQIPARILQGACRRFGRAMSRWAKTDRRPQPKKRIGTQSVVIGAELFTIQNGVFYLASRSVSYGPIKWVAHTKFGEPRQISISREADGKWFVGFSFDVEQIVPTLPERIQTKEEIVACDRGVVNPLSDSTGRFYNFTQTETQKQSRREERRGRLQRKAKNQRKGSKRRVQTMRRISKCYGQERRLRQAVSHRIANHVVNHALLRGAKAIAFEDLRLSNMTRRAKPKQDPDGTYLPNAQSAKSGLNKSLLSVSLGQIKTFVQYRCARQGLHFLNVAASYSSQECPQCHHIHAANRQSQSEFYCQSCDYADHADLVAPLNLQKRAFHQYRDIAGNCSATKTEKKDGRSLNRSATVKRYKLADTPP